MASNGMPRHETAEPARREAARSGQTSGGLDLPQIKTQAQKSASEYCVEHPSAAAPERIDEESGPRMLEKPIPVDEHRHDHKDSSQISQRSHRFLFQCRAAGRETPFSRSGIRAASG